MSTIKKELPVVAGLVLSVINAIQVAALSLPPWAHTVIAIVSIMAGAIVVRQNVQPATRPPA